MTHHHVVAAVALLILIPLATGCDEHKPPKSPPSAGGPPPTETTRPEPNAQLAAHGLDARVPVPLKHSSPGPGVDMYSGRTAEGTFYGISVAPQQSRWNDLVTPNPVSFFVGQQKGLTETFGGQLEQVETRLVGGYPMRSALLTGVERPLRAAWIVADKRAFLITVSWRSSAAFEADRAAAPFLASLKLNDRAPAPLGARWRRQEALGLSLELPDALETTKVFGVAFAGGNLPVPGLSCGMATADESPTEAAVVSIDELVERLPSHYLAGEFAKPTIHKRKLGDLMLEERRYAGSFLPTVGGGPGHVHTAVTEIEGRRVVLVGAGWAGGDAVIDRCWSSLRAAAAPATAPSDGDTEAP